MSHQELAMFPLGRPVLPGELLPLRIFEDRYVEMLERLRRLATPEFGVVMIDRGSEVGGRDIRRSVGVRMRLLHVEEMSRGQFSVLTRAQDRLKVVQWLEDDPFPRARIEPLPDFDVDGISENVTETEALCPRVRSALRAAGLERVPRDQRLYALASALPIGPLDRQNLLEAPDGAHRWIVMEDILIHLQDLARFARDFGE